MLKQVNLLRKPLRLFCLYDSGILLVFMRSIYLFILVFSAWHFALAQPTNAKEIVKEIANANAEQRIKLLCIFYDDNLYTITNEKFDSVLAGCYRIAVRHNDPKFKTYLDLYKRGAPVMATPGEDRYVKEAKALKVWERMLKYYRSVDDSYFTAICNAYVGHYYFMRKEYEKSIERLLMADEDFRKVGYGKFPDIGKHLHNMALVFYFFRDHEKVAELMEISVKLPAYRRNYDIQRYNTLGAAYTHLKQYKKAESAFIKTRQTAIFYNDPLWVTIASRGLAKAWLYQGKNKEALQLYESTLHAAKEINENAGNSLSREYSEHLLGLAKTHIILNEFTQARHCLENLNYKAASNTKDQLFLFGATWQDMNYWVDFYAVQHQYHYAIKNYKKAYIYADSLYKIKYKIDSTFNRLGIHVAQNRIDAQNIQYQNDKKEATIKNREEQLAFIIVLLAVIILATVLLIRNNRKINRQNKIISNQLGELTKTLAQKQVLLSELQHRVKNNLQHVISILEIQKESVDFNNIDELIRGNQNRIHSMALLHKKMNVSENVNEVDLKRYVTELSELVKESYSNPKKKIELSIQCTVEKMSIEKALPVGLMIVELLSNSIKHAFKKQGIGLITIEISNDEILCKNKLCYADNGIGFDFNKISEKGLGQELIKGLIDQLNGTFEIRSQNGFELTVYF